MMHTPPSRLSLRRRIYRQIESSAWPYNGLSGTNKFLFVVISLAVLSAILETEPLIAAGHPKLILVLEDVFGTIFIVEYLVRIWASAEDKRYSSPWKARLRFIFSLSAIVDLLAIIVSLLTVTGVKPYLLRIFRLMRILRMVKMGRMSVAMGYLIEAILARKSELFFSFCIGMFFLILSASALYVVEGDVQPDKFGSIPRALWWATATLTTIGYGDVYPVTVLGKVFAAISAIAGIGLVAMPTGILAAAFSEAVQRHSRGEQAPPAKGMREPDDGAP